MVQSRGEYMLIYFDLLALVERVVITCSHEYLLANFGTHQRCIMSHIQGESLFLSFLNLIRVRPLTPD